ncbi:MAG TPA: DUF3298 domain-containing protein [Spirochaetia bacterium]|nr:DUF3298 domain-containing protein [Spirochaetia bacterium]
MSNIEYYRNSIISLRKATSWELAQTGEQGGTRRLTRGCLLFCVFGIGKLAIGSPRVFREGEDDIEGWLDGAYYRYLVYNELMNRRVSLIITAALFGAAGLALGLLLSGGGAGSRANLPAGAYATPMTIVSIVETASTSPTVTIEYPQFPKLPTALNDAIASATMSRLAGFRKTASETMKARAATGDSAAVIPYSAYHFMASWQPSQVNSRYISFIERYGSYAGGANGNEQLQTFNYDIARRGFVSLADLFPDAPDYLATLASTVRSRLASSMNSASAGHAPLSMMDAGTAPDTANFKNFTFTNDLVTIYFPKYAVAPGSFGEQHVTIIRSSIK